jgi:hypothetical protein
VTPRSFGIEAITDEDRAYAGSRFSDVREALFANPYQRTWGAAGEPPLPVHPVTLTTCSTASCRVVRPTPFAKPPSAPSIPLPTCVGARIEKASAA